MSKEIEQFMDIWSGLVNKEKTNTDDFWLDTPVGRFKNPKLMSNENDEVGEINITIQYDEWDKKQNQKDE